MTSAPPPVTAPPAAPALRTSRVSIPWRSLIMVGALVVIWIVFSMTTDGTFLRPRNLSLLARQTSVTAILAVGMVLVIVAGQIDLSVGALAGLMGGLAAISYMNRQWPLGVAFLAVLIGGSVLGAAQGSLVAWLKIPPFIVTLGGMLLFQGALLGITGGITVSPSRPFLYVGQTYVPLWLGWLVMGLMAGALIASGVRRGGTVLWSRVGFAVLVLATVALLWKELLYSTFDPLGAAAAGLPVVALDYLFLALIALTIVVSLQAVGIILVVAMLVTPAATAQLLSQSFGRLVATAAVIGIVAPIVGLYASFWLNAASGATIVLVESAVFVVALVVGRGTVRTQSASA